MTRTERVALYGLRHPWRLVAWWMLAWFVMAVGVGFAEGTTTTMVVFSADAWLLVRESSATEYVVRQLLLCVTPFLYGLACGAAVLVVAWFRGLDRLRGVAAGLLLVTIGVPLATVVAWETVALVDGGTLGDALATLGGEKGLRHQWFTVSVVGAWVIHSATAPFLRKAHPAVAITVALSLLAAALYLAFQVGSLHLLGLGLEPLALLTIPVWAAACWGAAGRVTAVERMLILALVLVFLPGPIWIAVWTAPSAASQLCVAVAVFASTTVGVLLPVRLSRTVRSMTPVPDDHPSRDWTGASA